MTGITVTIIETLTSGNITHARTLLYFHSQHLSEEDKDEILHKVVLDGTEAELQSLKEVSVTGFVDEECKPNEVLEEIIDSDTNAVEEARGKYPDAFEVHPYRSLIPFQHKHLCYLLDQQEQVSDFNAKLRVLLKDVKPDAYNLVQAVRNKDALTFGYLVFRGADVRYMTQSIPGDAADEGAIAFIEYICAMGINDDIKHILLGISL